MKLLINFVTCLALLNITNGQVINDVEWFTNLMKKFIHILKTSDITGNGLPMDNWSGTVNLTSFGVTAQGTVQFNSGFVNSIEKAELDKRTVVSRVFNDYVEIEGLFSIVNTHIFYDMDIAFNEYKDLANILISVPTIDFPVKVMLDYKTNVRTTDVSAPSVPTTNMAMKQYPNNGYTQLINKQIFSSFDFRIPFVANISNWKIKLTEYLDKAYSQVDPPLICYYCRQLEI